VYLYGMEQLKAGGRGGGDRRTVWCTAGRIDGMCSYHRYSWVWLCCLAGHTTSADSDAGFVPDLGGCTWYASGRCATVDLEHWIRLSSACIGVTDRRLMYPYTLWNTEVVVRGAKADGCGSRLVVDAGRSSTGLRNVTGRTVWRLILVQDTWIGRL
jgi:hypothetical protein